MLRHLVGVILLLASLFSLRAAEPVILTSGWQLQDSAKVSQAGAELSQPAFSPKGWLSATVPGTVLTSLVNDGVYPEPLYGENNRPDKIPDSLCRTSYWYRSVFDVPAGYAGKTIWLNFDGINYSAEIWVNGKQAGNMKGAFKRGIFDISTFVTPGQSAAVAVLVTPQPHPGVPIEHTVLHGIGKNGGITAIDGPTFLCTIGWDWLPGIRDRDSGIWQKVFLSATGPVILKEPLVTTKLPLPKLDSADIAIQMTLENTSGQARNGVLKGSFGDVSFTQPVELAAHASQRVSLDPNTVAALRVPNPKLWWPNGYGPQNLYTLHLSFEADRAVSDEQDVTFGIRQIAYLPAETEPATAPSSGKKPEPPNLTVSVNGVPILCKGGDWGLDEGLKRISRDRLEAQIRMHQIANYNIIRNWVGQSTSEDFYALCDKYGILLWDEFFQPNPSDGPNPTDLDTYLANVRDKILRFRNHPSIAIWCARNEGYPPKNVDDGLRKLLAELEPCRLYQPSSTAGHGVHSGGPYRWRTPRDFYSFSEAFKTEVGSVSIPTLESIQGMMPSKDWEVINDDWAEHDFARGASGSDTYRSTMISRYGKVANLADFARKGQLMNYEAFRAMYEGRNAKLFKPCTGVITWMSNPAQPSFVWQLYHHDLEPNSALFGTKKACEPVHIQLNEKAGNLEVINNLPAALENAHAHLSLYSLDGRLASQQDLPVTAAGCAATDLASPVLPSTLSPVYFVKLELRDSGGKLLSDNFYWRGAAAHPDDLAALDTLPVVNLTSSIVRHDADGKCLLDVTLRNPTSQVAIMAHLQLRRQASGERVLPVYYSDNYVSLVPNDAKTITIEAASADLKGDAPLIVLDGWNVGVTPSAASGGATLALNVAAQVSHWPVTGLPMYFGPAFAQVRNNCGGEAVAGFQADANFRGGATHPSASGPIDTQSVPADTAAVYATQRTGDITYLFPMKALSPGHTYTVRLHFAEDTFSAPGKRKFNVDINGAHVLKDFDIFQAAGAKNRALVKEFPSILPDGDGNIIINLRKGTVNQPTVCALEIVDSAGK